MFTPILRIMLELAHLAHSVYTLLRRVYDAVRRVYARYILQYVLLASAPPSATAKELETIARTLARVNKVPRHLVIVHGLHDRSLFLDCVRIVGWSVALDIPYISFFDRNGFLKKNEINLKQEIARKWPDLVEHIIWNSHTRASNQNGINGNRSKVTISFLSDIDGKGKIVTLTQSLAKAVSSGQLEPDEITDQLITEKLQVRGMPDPDLALIYGHTCSTHGLLPWHTRTTEFLMLPLYVNITVKDFACILEKYSKCVQRHGK